MLFVLPPQLGLTPGAAWQAAMSAAHEVGAQQVALIDRPVRITERKLSDALMAHAGARLGGALGLVLSSLVAFLATNNLPETTEVGLCVFRGSGRALRLFW